MCFRRLAFLSRMCSRQMLRTPPATKISPWSTVTELLLLMEAMTGNVSKSGS